MYCIEVQVMEGCTDDFIVVGDHLLNGSLNAAMMSGEKAAQGSIEVVEGNRGG